MRVAICDDEKIYRDETKEYIREYNEKIEIVEFVDGKELLKTAEQFDLIFLDIQMPQLDGMTAAKQLRRQKTDAEIVFLTNYDQYVYDAFDIRALQFLRKPVEKERLVKVLRTVEKALAEEEQAEFALNGETVYVKIKDIVYIESYGDGLYIYDKNGQVYEERRGTIKKWSGKLKEKGFVQIHRSYLISMFYIENYGTDQVKLKGIEEKLAVSRRHATDFKETFFSFVNANGRVL